MAEISIEPVWQKIISQLKPGMSIRNWTALNGYLGDEMKVVRITNDKIVIDSPKAKYHQHVTKDDFEVVWKNWDDYKSGQVQRQEIRKNTRFSKYVISVLHWLEENK